MSHKKIILVTGATGTQGGSVAQSLLKDGTFAVRALTRNPDSAVAKELAAQGVEIVKGDLKDPASLTHAFKGVYGAFGVTNYWEPGVGAEGEVTQGKHLVDAAKEAGVQHFVWSTLDATRFKAAHWECKAEVDDYLKASGVPRTSLYTSYYFENFHGIAGLRKTSEGSYEFIYPMVPDSTFAVYPAAETGAYVLAAFLNPTAWINQDMRICSAFLSLRDMIDTIGEVSGKPMRVNDISEETWKEAKGKAILEDLHVNMELLWRFNKPPFRDPELSRKLYPDMKTFRQWVQDNVDKIFP